jgi:hypothetical protein
VQGFGGLAEFGSGAGESGGGGGLLRRGGDGGAVMPEGQELLQAGGGLICSVATPRSIARAPAAIACVSAAPGQPEPCLPQAA